MINLSKATDAITSRGPDNLGLYNSDFVGLGHTRLSIIDTSAAGSQPMTDPTGRYRIVYNGEIYNFKELRKELVYKGEKFTSETDTEVLLRLYIKEGKACLQKLNGFFAFAVYDTVNHLLFLARDRMGIKPLCYYHNQDKFIFASEIKSILAYGVEHELDTVALYQYLQLNYTPAPATMFKGIRRLMPGECISIDANGVKIENYYKIPKPNVIQVNYEEARTKIRELVEESVKRRLVADVPLGTFLSGGIDSSIISALAKKHKPDLHTFSIGYKDEPFFDETSYARLVAKHIGSEHTVFSLSNKDLFDNLYEVLDYFDEPFADSSAIAVYILSKETRKYSTVALSGDGADELFGGYNKHRALHRIVNGGGLSSVISNLGMLWRVLPKSRNNPLTNRIRQLDRFARGKKLSAKDRYWLWAGITKEQDAYQLISPELRSSIDIELYQNSKGNLLSSIIRDDINHFLFSDLKMVLPNDMLIKVDLMSMANSLEIRTPFLDHKLVEYVQSLPGEFKVNANMGKKILQDAFRKELPTKLYNRPKKGFEVPLLKWFRKELKPLIIDNLLSDRMIQSQGIFDQKEIHKIKRRLFSSNPGDVHARIWGLIVFQWWWKKFF